MTKSTRIKKIKNWYQNIRKQNVSGSVSPSCKDRNLRQMALNLSKKFDMSGKLFCKQPWRGVVENGVIKIWSKFSNHIYEGVPFLSYIYC